MFLKFNIFNIDVWIFFCNNFSFKIFLCRNFYFYQLKIVYIKLNKKYFFRKGKCYIYKKEDFFYWLGMNS